MMLSNNNNIDSSNKTNSPQRSNKNEVGALHTHAHRVYTQGETDHRGTQL